MDAESDVGSVVGAATAVMKVLSPLESNDRVRVLQSVAALFEVTTPFTAQKLSSGQGGRADATNANGEGNLKPLSLVEFVREKLPANNAQRFATFAYFREHHEKKPQHFARSDLKPYFAAAKVAAPKNYDRDFTEVAREGWIHEEGNQSYLTTSGEAAVQEGFGGKGKPRGKASKKKNPPKPIADAGS